MLTLYRNFAPQGDNRTNMVPLKKPTTRGQHWLLLLLLLTNIDAIAVTTDPDWCSNYQPELTDNSETGRLVLHTSLVAHMRIAMPVNPVKVTVTGLGKDLPVKTSSPQCSGLVVIDQLPPGQYRLQSIEGSVDLFTAPKRFIHPGPGDGYRLILSGGNQGLYRVPVPRELNPLITIKAGETSFAGALNISANSRRIWAIDINWNPQPPAGLCDEFNRRYQQQIACN